MGDVSSVPKSFDIVDLGNGELGLSGYPRVPLLPTQLAASGRVHGVGMLTSCDHALTI
jgi:hypothetical protein